MNFFSVFETLWQVLLGQLVVMGLLHVDEGLPPFFQSFPLYTGWQVSLDVLSTSVMVSSGTSPLTTRARVSDPAVALSPGGFEGCHGCGDRTVCAVTCLPGAGLGTGSAARG